MQQARPAGPVQLSTGQLDSNGFESKPLHITKKSITERCWTFLWWGRTDSNHRSETQQIYSLSPLATRELPHIKLARLEPVDGLEPPTY